MRSSISIVDALTGVLRSLLANIDESAGITAAFDGAAKERRDSLAAARAVLARVDGGEVARVDELLEQLRSERDAAERAKEQADEARRAAWARLDDARSALDTAGAPESVAIEGGETRDLGIGERIDRLAEKLACAQTELLFIRGPACRVCGCTDEEACDGGCSWIEGDLCSECEGKETEASTARGEELRALLQRLGQPRVACGWCGEPATSQEQVRTHLLECKDHPMAALRADRDRLRAAVERIPAEILKQREDAGICDPFSIGSNNAFDCAARIAEEILTVALSPAPGDRLYGTSPELAIVDEFTPTKAPVDGTCCTCGDDGRDEANVDGVCSTRKDGTHCVHWWEGPDGDATPEKASEP